MRNKQKGFSLIELLIVVAIILIIAAIAIPNLLRSRMAANEASAVASCRTINTSEVVYSSTYPVGFAVSLSALSDGGTAANCTPPAVPVAANACLIDASLATGTKSGYNFKYVTGAPVGTVIPTYTIQAVPLAIGSTGQRGFFTDESNVVRSNPSGTATLADPAI